MTSFVDEPHAAIDGPRQGEIVNLTDRRAAASRRRQLELLRRSGPTASRASSRRSTRRDAPAAAAAAAASRHAGASRRARRATSHLRRLHGKLAAAADRGPADFAELLLTPGVGARTVRALALVAEVVHGAPCRFTDPARFSLAHGGKDGHPFPVPLKVYDETIGVLKSRRAAARSSGARTSSAALKRLDDQARRLERRATGAVGRDDHRRGAERCRIAYGGRSVFGWEPPPASSSGDAGSGQILRKNFRRALTSFFHHLPALNFRSTCGCSRGLEHRLVPTGELDALQFVA